MIFHGEHGQVDGFNPPFPREKDGSRALRARLVDVIGSDLLGDATQGFGRLATHRGRFDCDIL